MGKLSLMKESSMPEGAEMESKEGLSGPSVLHYQVPELGKAGPKSQPTSKWRERIVGTRIKLASLGQMMGKGPPLTIAILDKLCRVPTPTNKSPHSSYNWKEKASRTITS